MGVPRKALCLHASKVEEQPAGACYTFLMVGVGMWALRTARGFPATHIFLEAEAPGPELLQSIA